MSAGQEADPRRCQAIVYTRGAMGAQCSRIAALIVVDRKGGEHRYCRQHAPDWVKRKAGEGQS